MDDATEAAIKRLAMVSPSGQQLMVQVMVNGQTISVSQGEALILNILKGHELRLEAIQLLLQEKADG